MKIFVTGGTGFIGSHFLKQALEAGHDVIALRRSGSQPRIPLPAEPHWVDGDLATVDLSSCFAEPGESAFVHLAAHGVSPQPCHWKDAFQYNVADALSLVSKAIDLGIQRVVICGSCFEYGRSAERYETIPPDAPLEPIGPYASSKAAQSVALAGLCRERGFSLAILRPFTVFGDGQHDSNFWPSLRKAALSNADFPMTPGEQIRDFISAEDAASAFLAACQRRDLLPGVPLIENVGSGQPQTLRRFAELWWKHWAAQGKLLFGAVPYRPNEVMSYVPKI